MPVMYTINSSALPQGHSQAARFNNTIILSMVLMSLSFIGTAMLLVLIFTVTDASWQKNDKNFILKYIYYIIGFLSISCIIISLIAMSIYGKVPDMHNSTIDKIKTI